MSEDGDSSDRDLLDGLEARLQSHAKAFESLLALTPARDYYGSQIVDGRDPSEQWNRKKQTKEEKRAAKRAKLDPANQKSALDVLREREEEVKAKRKREAEGEAEHEDADHDDVEETSVKRRKGQSDADASEAKRREKAEKRKEKRLRKKEKSAEKKTKAEKKKERKQERDLADAQIENGAESRIENVRGDDGSDDEVEPSEHPADLENIDISGLADAAEADVDLADEYETTANSSAPTTPIIASPAFDLATNHSATSSSSSISLPSKTDQASSTQAEGLVPGFVSDGLTRPNPIRIETTPPTSTMPISIASGTSSPKLQLPKINHEELQDRVRSRINALRAARKADGPDGRPFKSRQELLDQRRRKEEQRKLNKKAQRAKEKEDEARKREDQLRGSGSPLSKVGDIFSTPPPAQSNYSFSRLAMEDDTDGQSKKKGPSDPRTALQAAENKSARFSALNPDKQARVAKEEMWKNASQRVHGEKGSGEPSLLKKALKRKEKGKEKSERAWKEREEGVVKAKEAKQKKRERNLEKRRDEKGKKGGKKVGKKGKPKARPGFEGRFKA